MNLIDYMLIKLRLSFGAESTKIRWKCQTRQQQSQTLSLKCVSSKVGIRDHDGVRQREDRKLESAALPVRYSM